MKNEHYATYQKKIHAYIEKEFPDYFTSVNRVNFFATFIHPPEGYGEIYNKKKRGIFLW